MCLILSYSPKPILTLIWCLASANFGPCQQGSLNVDTQKVYYLKKAASDSHMHFLFLPRAEKFTSTVGGTLYSYQPCCKLELNPINKSNWI